MKTSLLPRILLLLSVLPSCNSSLAEGMGLGCTDPFADNYNPEASINDGSCSYAISSLTPVLSMDLPGQLLESSGLLLWEGTLWTHNDSEDTHLYGLDTATAEIVEEIALPGVVNTDWEDIAQDDDYIYLGDFGNNLGSRRDLHILKINKATLRSRAPQIDTIHFSFEGQEEFSDRPRGHDYDCEAMTIIDDRIVLFTKQWQSAGTEVHILDCTPGQQATHMQGSLQVDGLITGATSSPDGKLIILSAYTVLFQPFILVLSDFPEGAYFDGNKRKIQIDLPYHQVEGISLVGSGEFFLSNEAFSASFFPPTPQRMHRFILPF